MKGSERPAVAATILALGLSLGGLLIGQGFASGRTRDRYVEVKGLAEQEVTADLALWPLRYVTTGDDLSVAQATVNAQMRRHSSPRTRGPRWAGFARPAKACS
jgi:uncharacterized protein